MLNASVEVRFPLFKGLSGAIFEDVGLLADNPYSLSSRSGVLAATGFGLRYDTPLGPLRFDVGWKLPSRQRFDRSYAWFLTFEHMF